MKRFSDLKAGEQFKLAGPEYVGIVYTALMGPRPSDTYYINDVFELREANPHAWVKTKVMKEVWE